MKGGAFGGEKSLLFRQAEELSRDSVSVILAVQGPDASRLNVNSLQPILFLDKEEKSQFVVTMLPSDSIAYDIVLCADISGSMKGEPIERLRQLLAVMVGMANSQRRFALMTFADDVVQWSPMIQDTSALMGQVHLLRAGGFYTSLYGGACKAIESLEASSPRTFKAVVLISDGHNESLAGSYDKNDVVSKAVSHRIPVLGIGVPTKDKQYLETLDYICDKTGGKMLLQERDSNSPTGAEAISWLERNSAQFRICFPKALLEPGRKIHQIGVSGTIGDERVQVEFDLAYERDSSFIVLWIFVPFSALALGALLVVWRRKRSPNDLLKKAIGDGSVGTEVSTPCEGNIHTDEPLKREAGNQVPGSIHSTVAARPFAHTVVGEQNSVMKTSKLRIELQRGPNFGTRFDISGEASVGRNSGNTVVLSDQHISGRHARIVPDEQGFRLFDLDSTNGTFVNSVRIKEHLIMHNDTFKIGESEGVFLYLH